MLKIAVLGTGRMGRQVASFVDASEDCEVAGVWSRANAGDLDELLRGSDVAIDFTLPQATAGVVAAARQNETPLVCGVTNVAQAEHAAMASAAAEIPILYERNMSVGIAVMLNLAQRAAERLGTGFSIGIQETHHVHKKDAPSGTALMLREALHDERIGIESRREGDVVGDHTIRFASEMETLEIRHHVNDRRAFAEGAVVAARWLVAQPPGLYRMASISA